METSLLYIEFLNSEYEWCIEQYKRTLLPSYVSRALILETLINRYFEAYNDNILVA